MSKKPIFHTTKAESKLKHFVRVRPLGKQPRKNSHCKGFACLPDNKKYVFFSNEFYGGVEAVPLRHPTGTYMMFAPTKRSRLGYYYPNKYLSAKLITIPMATDYELDITTSVKRVQELTGNELNEISQNWSPLHCTEYDYETDHDARDDYIKRTLIPEWNTLYGKPVKTKDGKGYEDLSYGNNPYVEINNAERKKIK